MDTKNSFGVDRDDPGCDFGKTDGGWPALGISPDRILNIKTGHLTNQPVKKTRLNSTWPHT